MVILEIPREDPFQVALVENDDVIQTISADTANNSFHIRILPGASRCRDYLFNEEAPHAAAESLTIDGIAIPKQIARCGIPRKGLDHLLSHPLDRRVLRDIERDYLWTIVRKDHENLEHFEIDRWDHEKIDRH